MQNRGGWLSGYEQCDSRCSRRRNHYAAAGLLWPVNNISANVDRAYTIDLNGHSVRKDSGGISLAVYAGTPKIVDSKGGGVIAGLEIDSSLDLTLADLLPEGWDFQEERRKLAEYDGSGRKNGVRCHRGAASIQSMNYPTGDEHDLWRYGDASCQGSEGNRHRRCELPVVQGGGR